MKSVRNMMLGCFLLGMVIGGCTQPPATSVVVVDSSGAAVAGAEVFLARQNPASPFQLQGTTNASGSFIFSPALSSGDQLFARRRVYEHASYRPDHGPGSGWVEHVYQTSRIVNDNGSVTDLTVTNPTGTETLTVSPNNVLIGWHLVASLDWDASDDELADLRMRFTDASDYLYNLTDGQFLIEQVEIADDAQLWGSAEVAFQVDSWVWPHTNYNGGFLGPTGGSAHVFMAPFSVYGYSKQPHRLVHELGHLALGLLDEYMGFNALDQNYCTSLRLSPTADADFRNGGKRAACAMDADSVTSKLCSAHNDSAHRGGNLQAGPCWTTVSGGYSDPRPGIAPKDSWVVRTPDQRGVVVGPLPKLPAGLQPQINLTNRHYHDLCKPITFVDQYGAAAANGTVWVTPAFWSGNFSVGRLDSNGQLEVRGVHLGDEIRSPWHTLRADSTNCIVTQ
jgi:hypothetical protein